MKKRIIHLVLSLLLVLSVFPFMAAPALAATVATLPLVEDFSTISSASLASDYILTQTVDSTVHLADDPKDSSNKVVMLDDPGTGTAGFGRQFTQTTGIVTTEFDFMQPVIGGSAKVIDLYGGSSGTTVAVEIQAVTGGSFTYNGTTFGSGLLVANTWIHFKIVVDTTTGAARPVTLYVGKKGDALEEVTNATAFKSAVTYLNKFDSTTPGGTGRTHYLDNIKIYSGTTPPGSTQTQAPTGLNAVAGNNQVTLTWSSTVTGATYAIKRGTQAGGPYMQIGTSTTKNYTDTTAANGTTYYYVVTATAPGQTESVPSNEVSAKPIAPPAPPAAPTGVTASPGDTKVNLTWAAVSDATSYKVKRSTDGQTYSNVGSNQTTTSYADNGLTNGTKYYYIVTAVNANGETDSASVYATPTATPVPPSVPTGLTVGAGNGQITLSWTAANGAVSYNVKRSIDGQNFVKVNTSPVSATNYTDTGLTNTTLYYYVVTAVNGNGESANSNAASATPIAPPALDAYNLAGFSYGNTGGGILLETDPKYIKVYNATDFAKAINRKSGYKIVEIMNDLNLGWNELTDEAKTAAGALFVANSTPLTNPVLMQTGVSKIYLDTLNNMTIFSANGAKIKHAGLTIKHSSNLIIRNLEFDELWEWDEATKGNYDKNDWDFMTVEDDSKVWIDHCTFNKSYDGGIDVKQGSSGVTISWSLFKGDDRSPNSWVTQQINALEANKSAYPMYKFIRDQGLSVEDIIAVSAGQKKQHLVGATEFDSKNPNLQVTLHHNYYKDMQDRLPRLRGGNAHAYNIIMDSADNWAAKKRISAAQEAAITAKSYHFGVTSNGAISTEGGAVLVENSQIIDIFYPMRNNQVDAAKTQYTGKIKAVDTIYSMDGVTYRGDSDTPNSPMTPVPAAPLDFSWSGMTALPYTYTLDDPSTLMSRLKADNGSGAGKLAWSKENWLLTSGYSSSSGTPTTPGTVAGITASALNNGQVALKWNAVSGAKTYSVKRSTTDGSGYQTIAPAVQGVSYTDTNVAVGTTYYYVVSASNEAGEGGNSQQVSVKPAIITVVAPSAPSITATASDAVVNLSWGTVSGATSYKVKRSTTDGSGYSDVGSPISTNSYKDTSVTNETTYYYVVTALNEAGESANSNQVSAKPSAVADVTTGLKVLVDDNFNNQTTGANPVGYVVSEAGGTVQISNVPSATNKSIYINDTSATTFSQISKSFPQQTDKVVAQLDFMQQTKANSAKVLRLQPAQGGGSPAVSIETVSGNITYRNAGDTYTTLSGYNASSWYTIQVVADLTTQKADIYINGALKLQQAPFYAANSSLSLLESYTSNGGAVGHYVDNVKIFGSQDSTTGQPPVAPTTLNAIAGKGQVSLTWGAVEGASYTVKRKTDANGTYTTVMSNLTQASYVDTNVTNGTTYYYVVTASNADGESGSSNETTATPTTGNVTVPTVTLSGASSVKSGETFSFNYGLVNVSSAANEAIYAQDITFQYDTNKLEFVDAVPLQSTHFIAEVKKDVAGQIRIFTGSEGTAGAITTDGPLIKLNWKARPGDASTTTVSTLQAQLANSKGDVTQANTASISITITSLNRTALQAAIDAAQVAYTAAVEGTHTGQYPTGSKATLKAAIDAAQAVLAADASTQAQLDKAENDVKQALQAFQASKLIPVPGDLNGDRVVNVGDLGIISAAYVLTSSSPNWDEVKHMDINNDGIINIVDVVEVAKNIP